MKGPGVTHSATHRRSLTVAALIAAPLLKLLSILIWPDQTGSISKQLATSAAHPAAWTAGALLDLAAALALVAGVFGIRALIRVRGARLAAAGCGLVALVALGDTASTAVNLVQVEMAKQPGRAQMVSLYHSFSHSPLLIFVAFILIGGLGVVLVALALVRSGRASRWLMLPAAAAWILAFAEGPRLGNLLQLLALATCLLWMARTLPSEGKPQEAHSHSPRSAAQPA
jgi:hypothetical protein